jgi:hypothetical protein
MLGSIEFSVLWNVNEASQLVLGGTSVIYFINSFHAEICSHRDNGTHGTSVYLFVNVYPLKMK